MISKLSAAFALSLLLNGQAFAWTATAFDRNGGGSVTHSDAFTPQEAQAEALDACRRNNGASDCVMLGDAVRATTVVVARGTDKRTDDSIFVVARQSPDEAAKGALSDCRKSARNCRLALAQWDRGHTWAALAVGRDSIYIAYDMHTREEAESRALTGCEEQTSRKQSCAVRQEFSTSERAWYVLSRSEAFVGFSVSRKSEAEAKDIASNSCREGSNGSPCKVSDVVLNTGPVAEPAAFRKLAGKVEQERKQRELASSPKKASIVPTGGESCRPRTVQINCTSQCQNGDCVVTYENGCKVRIQVSPQYNPFNNRWEYPAPSC